MINSDKPQKSGSARWGLAGAMVAAIAASACCVGPLVLMFLGISGAWIGTLTALAPYQPIFMTVAVVLLGLSFYKMYHKPKEEECAPGSYCASPSAGRFNKIILWIFTAAIAGLLMFPYAAPYVFAGTAKDGAQTQEATFSVKNMTCASCLIPVRRAIGKLDGVESAKVTVKPGMAVVIYDPAKVKPADIAKAITNAGYPASVKKKQK